MYLNNPSEIIGILERTLNYVDSRLIDHGRRVADTVYKIISRQKKYTENQIRDICVLALIHDIGAYKTEDIDNMTEFEVSKVWEHAIYGYLFVKNFSPIKNMAPVLLFHHAKLDDLEYIHPSYREIIQLIRAADHIDLLARSGQTDIELYRKSVEAISSSYITSLIFEQSDFTIEDFIKDKGYEYSTFLYHCDFSDQEIDDYIKMIILSIDFRSPQTLSHTMVTAEMSLMLGRLMGCGEQELNKIRTAAVFHDIGKVGIPVSILENTGRLSEEEMAVMKTHVAIGEMIIDKAVKQETNR